MRNAVILSGVEPQAERSRCRRPSEAFRIFSTKLMTLGQNRLFPDADGLYKGMCALSADREQRLSLPITASGADRFFQMI